jgi:CRP-like cAMP-binding protein
VVEPGSVIPGLFVLASGVLVASRKEGEREVEVVRLGPGDCFGEASVLTGAVARAKISALTNVALYQISKDDLAPLLKERPSIAAELGRILARREATVRERLEQNVDSVGHRDDLAAWLTERVKTLFHLT